MRSSGGYHAGKASREPGPKSGPEPPGEGFPLSAGKKRNTVDSAAPILYNIPCKHCGGVAQLGERLNGIQEVRSSILLVSTIGNMRVPNYSGLVFYCPESGTFKIRDRKDYVKISEIDTKKDWSSRVSGARRPVFSFYTLGFFIFAASDRAFTSACPDPAVSLSSFPAVCPWHHTWRYRILWRLRF